MTTGIVKFYNSDKAMVSSNLTTVALTFSCMCRR